MNGYGGGPEGRREGNPVLTVFHSQLPGLVDQTQRKPSFPEFYVAPPYWNTKSYGLSFHFVLLIVVWTLRCVCLSFSEEQNWRVVLFLTSCLLTSLSSPSAQPEPVDLVSPLSNSWKVRNLDFFFFLRPGQPRHYSLGEFWICYVAEADLELLILLPSPFRCWHYRLCWGWTLKLHGC